MKHIRKLSSAENYGQNIFFYAQHLKQENAAKSTSDNKDDEITCSSLISFSQDMQLLKIIINVHCLKLN